MQTKPQYRERSSSRQPVHVVAKLIFPDLSKCIDCVVRDISKGGVLVSTRGYAPVPDRLYLWQADAGAMVECEVRWRKLNLMGLKFLETAAVAELLTFAENSPRGDTVVPFRAVRAA